VMIEAEIEPVCWALILEAVFCCVDHRLLIGVGPIAKSDGFFEDEEGAVGERLCLSVA
jgi:hypothetical protein